MPPKKGLSFEEKRAKMLEIFHETKDFWQLKELEKMGPKLKGVISQSVKEVIDALVADGNVCSEKIGTSIYYWSFPSSALLAKNARLIDLESQVNLETKRKKDLESQLNDLLSQRQECEERSQALERLQKLEFIHAKLSQELTAYRDDDPALFESKKLASQQAKEAVVRWTDNIFSLESYCKNKFGMSSADFEQAFEIPELSDI